MKNVTVSLFAPDGSKLANETLVTENKDLETVFKVNDPILWNAEHPTLYKLVNNGFVFENYYQPLFTVSTSDGEYMFLNSLIPKEGVWSFYRSSNIYMPFGVGNVFKREGYSTVNAYHDHTYTYYNRDESHPNLGFDKYIGCGNGLEELINCKTWPESDVEMINATVDDYISSDNFMTYYMTVSGHLQYTPNDNMMVSWNWSKVKDLNLSLHAKSYLACNIEFFSFVYFLK